MERERPDPRGAKGITQDLHALLDNAGIEGPYVYLPTYPPRGERHHTTSWGLGALPKRTVEILTGALRKGRGAP
jgi:hypothetical protein